MTPTRILAHTSTFIFMHLEYLIFLISISKSQRSNPSQKNAKMANPAMPISIDDQRVQGSLFPPSPEFSNTEHQISDTPTSQTLSPSSDSDVSTLLETTIFHIPPGIIDQILTYLPLEDKACFIITCSHFYFQYQVFLNDKSLRECRPIDMSGNFDTLTKRPKVIYRKGSVTARPKIKLLRRLENENWKLCFDCWKLYPTIKSADTETGTDANADSPTKPCMSNAGIVELCPCVNLTFTDCININRALIFISSGTWNIPQEWFANLFHIAWHDDTESDGVLRHDCPTHNWFKGAYHHHHPFEKIRVKMDISQRVQADGADYLYVRREITLVLPEGMKALYAFMWLYDYFEDDPKTMYFGEGSVDQEGFICLETEKCLGRARWTYESGWIFESVP